MKILNYEQNTPEWFKAKKGRSSSSRVKNVLVEKIINKTDVIAFKMEEYSKEAEKLYENIEDEKEKKKSIKSFLDGCKKELSGLDQREIEALAPKEMYEEAFVEAQKKEYYRLLAEQLGYEDDELEDPRDRGHRLEPEAAEEVSKKLLIDFKEYGICVRDDYENISLSPDRLASRENVITTGLEIKSPGVVNHLEIWKTKKIPSEYFWQIVQYFVVIDELEEVYFVSYNPIVKECPLIIIRKTREELEYYIKRSLNDQKNILDHIEKDKALLTF